MEMVIKTLLLLIFFLSQGIFAKEIIVKKPSSKIISRKPALLPKSKIKVTPLSDEWRSEDLDNSIYDIQTEENNPKKEVLSPRVRDEIFKKTGAMRYVVRWDQLDKDMLILRLRHRPLQVVQKKYPMIPADILVRLKREIFRL